MRKIVFTVAASAALGWSSTAQAVTAQQKCEAGKNNAVGKYAACRLKAEKNLVLNGDATKYAATIINCDAKLTKTWTNLEQAAIAAGTTCPSTGDLAAVQTRVAGDTDAVADKLTGTMPTALRRLPASGQTTSYAPGDDGAVQAGAVLPLSYTDNSDGTITDNKTGLMWEKLDKSGSAHDVSNTFTWATAFSSKIVALNTTPCFAGYCDWRLPNVKELESLVDYGRQNPAIDPSFNANCVPGCVVATCSCTSSPNFMYWSSTTFVGDPSSAWLVDFYNGSFGPLWSGTTAQEKVMSGYYLVRAVRGGL